MFEALAWQLSSSGAAITLSEAAYVDRKPAYVYSAERLPRVEAPVIQLSAYRVATRYPTESDQEIFRKALWASAKVIRRTGAKAD